MPDAPHVLVWGLTPEERLRRALRLAGCAHVAAIAADAEPPAPSASAVVAVRADWIVDERILVALLEAPAPVQVAAEPGGPAVAARLAGSTAAAEARALREGVAGGLPGLPAETPARLVPAYTAKLRKSEPPFLMPARPDAVEAIERRTFGASYKGATDLVTKWVWPASARRVTGLLARAGVRPNSVTLLSWLLALAVVGLFAQGAFGAGLVLAWAMTFLDTVDGKLARVTLTSSRLGDVLDHGLDLVHPPVWWWAWGVGLGASMSPDVMVVVGGYFAGRAMEGVFLARFGFETHSWRPVDTLFRTITARRNPNLILLSVGALAGRPDLGMRMLAIWTLVSLAFHAVRLVQVFAARRSGRVVEPWDRPATPAPEPSGPAARA